MNQNKQIEKVTSEKVKPNKVQTSKNESIKIKNKDFSLELINPGLNSILLIGGVLLFILVSVWQLTPQIISIIEVYKK